MRTDSANRLKPLAILFLAATAAGTLMAAEPVAWGDWSVPVNGLRARLLVAYESVSNGPPIKARVSLELRNVGSQGHPLEVLYGCPPRLELTNASGEAIRREPFAFASTVLPPDWLVLPEGATLRFRTDFRGDVLVRREGLLIHVAPHTIWVIPEDSDEDYFLSGEFEVGPPPGTSDHPYAWKGALELPKVRISRKRTAAAGNDPDPRPLATGEWSERANDFRGRLLYCGYSRSNNVHVVAKAAIFMQLENLANIGNPVGIYYGMSCLDCPLHWELFDSSGHLVPRADHPGTQPAPDWSSSVPWRAVSIDIPRKPVPGGTVGHNAGGSVRQQPSYWLMLPEGSRLTLPVTLDANLSRLNRSAADRAGPGEHLARAGDVAGGLPSGRHLSSPRPKANRAHLVLAGCSGAAKAQNPAAESLTRPGGNVEGALPNPLNWEGERPREP